MLKIARTCHGKAHLQNLELQKTFLTGEKKEKQGNASVKPGAQCVVREVGGTVP